ncbi:MAPK protein hog1 [Blyttiomyces sp. JEL0837]|nr:MAPK protein hog1 [Blyttiomyces sp. JEL0837]
MDALALDAAQVKKIKLAFNTFDQAQNGTCDVREVGTIIRSLGVYPSEEQLRNWIKEMEEEEPTGYVQFDKFLKVVQQILATNPSRHDEEQIFRAFQALDAEKKGYLLPEELQKFLMTEGEPFSQEEIDEMLNACTDPTENKIYYEDYVTVLAYTDLQPVGMGAFGLVCSAKDQFTGMSVAVKKIMKPFSTPVLAKRTFRELKLLKHLRHENIISLSDIFISPLEDIYFVTELLGTDLHRLLTSRPLEKQFVQYFLYQILRGLKFVHSAGVVHRDLKPSNILVNENCDLKICDFGLARVTESQMTGYVSTRYYRAPEIMLTWQKYDEAVDIWSVGCIFAEMLEGKPLFPGKDHVHQFSIITELLGTPPDDVIQTICSENTLRFVQSLPLREKVSFQERFKMDDPAALDLLEKMLVFDPRKRITAAQALEHPYLAPYHDPSDEPVADSQFDWSFTEAELSVDEWKTRIYTEVLEFHGQEPTFEAAVWNGDDGQVQV